MRSKSSSYKTAAITLTTSGSAGFEARVLHTPITGNVSRHWARNDPFSTVFFNCLSAVFPRAELFMIRSLAPWKDRTSGQLSAEIAVFIEQEASHSHEHLAMNRSLVRSGYNLAPLDAVMRNFITRLSGTSDLVKLTATMCVEHLTAIIAVEILKNDDHLRGSDPTMHDMWLWHAIEEAEHKAVAYDTWLFATRDWNGLQRWSWRCTFLTLITISFLINRTRGQMELLRQDGFSRSRALLGTLRFGFGKGGIGRNILRPFFDFFRPGFHPWDHDDRALIACGDAVLAARATAMAPAEPEPVERRKKPRLAKAA